MLSGLIRGKRQGRGGGWGNNGHNGARKIKTIEATRSQSRNINVTKIRVECILEKAVPCLVFNETDISRNYKKN